MENDYAHFADPEFRKTFSKGLAEIIAEAVERATAPLRDRVRELEIRLEVREVATTKTLKLVQDGS